VIEVIAVLCGLSSSANCHEQTVIASHFAEVLMRSCMMGRAPARVDEGVSRRAPGGMALRDRLTGWLGSLEGKAAFLGKFARIGRVVNVGLLFPTSTPRTKLRRTFSFLLPENPGVRNDKTHRTGTESRWIVASSRAESQSKRRAYFREPLIFGFFNNIDAPLRFSGAVHRR
jgi:hypothetical protein